MPTNPFARILAPVLLSLSATTSVNAQVLELDCRQASGDAFRLRIDYAARQMSVTNVSRDGTVLPPAPYMKNLAATITEDQVVAVMRWGHQAGGGRPVAWSRWKLNRRTGLLVIDGSNNGEPINESTQPCERLAPPKL
jgi:hypothetical protein